MKKGNEGKYDDIDHHESLVGAGDATPGGDAIETIAMIGFSLINTFPLMDDTFSIS